VSLRVFLTDVEQADSRIGDAEHVARDDRAHGGELRELQRRRLRVGAEIEDVCVAAVSGRHRRHDGSAFDGSHGLQDEVRHRRERTGIAGTDHGARPTVFHEVDGDAHRGVLAAADRFARVFGHADHRRRRMHGHAGTNRGRHGGQRRFDDFGLAHEDQLEGGIGGECAQRAGYALRRTAVATHHIDGDRRHALRARLGAPLSNYSSVSTSAGFSMTRLPR
jgi:hypothetical protein